MVEGTGLENRRTRKGIVSSNLTLSAGRTSKHGSIRQRAGSASIAPSARLACAAASVRQHDLDRWPSGLRRTPGKCVYVKAYREFESHPIRHPARADLSPAGRRRSRPFVFGLSAGHIARHDRPPVHHPRRARHRSHAAAHGRRDRRAERRHRRPRHRRNPAPRRAARRRASSPSSASARGATCRSGALDITLYRDDLQTVGPRPVVGPTDLPWASTASAS